MQAVRIHDYGDASVLKLEQAPRPEPQANQVLIRLRAAGVNPADSAMRNGAFKQFMELQFPWTPGLEGAGTVEGVGAEVQTFKPGDEVYGFLSGGYAEYAVGNANDLQVKPSKLTMEEAAASPMGTAMAWAALIENAKLEAGQQVLILGAAGGIGAFATQMALWKGARVIGVTSSQNLEFVRSLGARQVIDYAAAHFEDTVRDVDVVVDTVGGEMPERSWQTMRKGGILVTVAARLSADSGQAHGMRAASARRPTFGDHQQISELLEQGNLRPTIRQTFTLAQAREAQELSETRHGRGRIILSIP